MENDLSSRRRELESRARERGLDVDSHLARLDASDEGLVIVALGSMLGLPIRQVFDVSVRLDEIERSASEMARPQQLLERHAEHWQELQDRLGEEGALKD